MKGQFHCEHLCDVDDALFSCTVFNAEQNPKLVCSSTFPFICRATSIQTFPFSPLPLVMNKKAPKNNEPETNYAERDIVLAKVRGFPLWPGMVVNPDNVPPAVAKERPAGKKTMFHCVRFFPAGDFAWLVSKDISKLKEHEIRAYISEPRKKNADLLTGYRIALDPEKWEKERESLEMAAAEQEDNAPVDQLETENEDEETKKPAKSKKRKRDADAASAKPKPKPKPKTDKKVATGKTKKNGAKSKEMIESEDEGDQEAEDEDAGTSAKAAPPPSKKPKREKEEEVDANLEADPEARKVREWRHRLQKALLGSKGAPSDEDMPALDQLFTTVEHYEHPNLINFLSFSKIGKVMRHIAALTPDKVPRDEEFKFRARAKALVDKWHAILGANKPSENGGEITTNGALADAVADASEVKAASSPAQNAISSVSATGATMSEA